MVFRPSFPPADILGLHLIDFSVQTPARNPRRSTIQADRQFIGASEAIEGGLIEGPPDELKPDG